MASSKTKELVLTDDDIENIILFDGSPYVNFSIFGWSENGDSSKLRDSHVIGLLSNHHHVDKQKVTSINLDDCDGITDDSLVFIADNFPQLKTLYVHMCFDLITDKGIIAVTQKCHKLTDINYSYCSKVGNAALEAIVKNLPLLKELDASNCNISILPDDFGDKLKYLEWLSLTDNKITTLPASIDKLKHLKRLYLIDNNIATLPVSIGKLKHLVDFELRNNNITALPSSIANLAGTCKNFGIDDNPLSEPFVEAVWGGLHGIKQYFERQTKRLKQAALATTQHDDDKNKEDLLTANNMGEQKSTIMASKTKKFVLKQRDHIKKIVSWWTVNFWTGLNYDDRLKLRDGHVIGLLNNPKRVNKQKVKCIDLTYCERITGASLVFIADHCPQLEVLYAPHCNISALPDNFGDKLKNLKRLYLHDNNITTLPVSITKLADTCTYFKIDDNPLSEPLLKEAANAGGLQGIKQYFESKKSLDRVARASTYPINLESRRVHTSDANEATGTSASTENNNVNTTTSHNDNARDGACTIESANHDKSAKGFLGKRSRRQDQQDTTSTSTDIPASTVTTEKMMPDEEQVVIKLEPLDHQTQPPEDVFDQKDYDMLRTHYLQPRVRRKEEIPSGMHLRRRYAPAAIDGKTEGYKQLKRQIQKLEKDNDVNGIYRLLKALRRFEVSRTPISSFIRGDNNDDGEDEVTEIIDLTSIPDNDDDDVIDVDTFIIDFLLVGVIKADPDALPPSDTYELPRQQLKKVKADPDTADA